MVVVKAKVIDSTHLELSAPLAAPRGRTIVISIAESAEMDNERRQWLAVSGEALQSAYGESEPEYTAAMVKESNAEYCS